MAIDVKALKGRVGEALVENILRQAGYQVCRLGRESQVHRLLKTGSGEFLPDFLVWKPVAQASDGAPLHRVLSVEVKYRSDVMGSFRRFGADSLCEAAGQWPELYAVYVTDNPEPGRSCFQVLDLRRDLPDAPPVTLDLHEVRELGIHRGTVREYEGLVKQLFELLNVWGRAQDAPRKPPAKMAGEPAPSLPVPAAAPGEPAA